MARIATARTRGRKWLAIRRCILQRDGYKCTACATQGKLTLAQEVDHVIPLEHGGTDAADNLASLCVECHKDKTALQRGSVIRVRIGYDGFPIA